MSPAEGVASVPHNVIDRYTINSIIVLQDLETVCNRD